MSNTEKGLFWLCVILTMAMAFTAMMISLPRVCNIHSTINFDYQTMIVTILGIFVTALIGWQIWQTVDVKNSIAKMERSVDSAEKRDVQLQHLLEAFQIDQTAKSQASYGCRYEQSVNALRSFILSGVPSAYIPIQNILERLRFILDKVEADNNTANRAYFAKVNHGCDNKFQDIVISINEQIGVYKDILEEIKRLNKRRIEINKDFVNTDPLEAARREKRRIQANSPNPTTKQ